MNMEMHRSQEAARALLRAGLTEAIACTTARLKARCDGADLPVFKVPESSAFPIIDSIFALSPQDIEILCLAAGAEMDADLCAAVEALSARGACDVSLAVRLLGDGGWHALRPEGPLRLWRLIELEGAGPLRHRHIRIDERVLRFLLGGSYLDTRLQGIVRPLRVRDGVAGQREAPYVDRIVRAWTQSEVAPVILLAGRDVEAKRAVMATVAARLGFQAYRLQARDIPSDWTQRSALAVFLDRELALSCGAVLIECVDEDGADSAGRMTDLLAGPVVIAARDPAVPEREPRLRIDLADANRDERRTLWQAALGPRALALGQDLDRITEQFSLDSSAVRAAVDEVFLESEASGEECGARLWQAAREQGRCRLDGLADRIESDAAWQDLILPQDQMSVLHDLAGHLREAWVVNQTWGWANRNPRGLGAAALFAGASGTGKTLAAEVLAAELCVDLYRIDLSQVVSKYIGETEKNLSRIFSAAEDGGGILLFDEADALFGKRSEVKDSHDRYANVEVSYLLQQMEAYRGLALLTTNQKSAVDPAFLRRLRYVVSFPFPDTAARAEIWARIFPDRTPVEGIEPARLARLNITGGSIRSVALNAAFMAAGDSGPVRNEHILRAANREYAKLEKPFTNAEIEAFR